MRRIVTAAVIGAGLAAGPALAFDKGQELTILTARSADLAARYCPYTVDEARMRAVLSRRGLTRAALSSNAHSDLLRDDIAADEARYANDTAAACDQAWASLRPRRPDEGPAAREVNG